MLSDSMRDSARNTMRAQPNPPALLYARVSSKEQEQG